MEEESGPQPPEGPIMCSNKCGFFGSSATMNMCSKCYRDYVLEQTKASKIKAAVEKSLAVDLKSSVEQNPRDKNTLSASGSSSSSSSDEGLLMAVAGEKRSSPNRCSSCRKRVGLTGFKCKCGDIFCSLHRYSENHDCSFDYKAAGRRDIEKANPLVKAEKIQKI